MKPYRNWVIVSALALAFPLALAAQNVAKGSIGGTIYDTSGGVVPDAKLTLSSEYGVHESKSNPDGSFLFLSLEPGKWSLRVEYTNFKVSELKDIRVRINERTTVDVKLEAGAVTQTITVSEASVGVDTSTTTSGGTITSDMFKSIPVGHRIQDIPYLVAGVNDGLGTGRANPSISGGSGLENLYIVNGVNIANAGYGALGTYSNIYGSLGSGVRFDFVKEVQVKTSGFEAQYGQALGGVVNMITKSGGNTYHGGVYFYGSPDILEATPLQSDLVRFNKGTQLVGDSAYDVGGELGGYLVRNRLFWFAGYDSIWTRDRLRGPSTFASAALGDVISKTHLNDYSAKITYNLTASQNHQLEGSVFGDPATAPLGPHRAPTIVGGGALQSDFPQRQFSVLDYGSRNWSARYTGALTPSWLVNASFNWARNAFFETGFPNIYGIQSRVEATPGGFSAVTGLPNRGLNPIGGIGFLENTTGNNKQANVNTSKSFRFWGGHQLDLGYQYEDVDYDWFHRRSGPDWQIPCTLFNGTPVILFDQSDCGKTVFGADGRLRTGSAAHFRFQQVRGAFTGETGTTNTKYHAGYFQDAWQLNKYITLKLGLRWEMQRIQGEGIAGAGVPAHYSFTDSWAPRAGIIVDPWGNRKTKFFFNFARFFEKIPQDLAVRSLSEERSYLSFFFGLTNPTVTATTGPTAIFNPKVHPTAGCSATDTLLSCLTNPANYILDAAHATTPGGFSGGLELFNAGTKMQYQDEFVVGMEHEFHGGVFVSVRYLDRRIRRIVEDISGVTTAAAFVGTGTCGPLAQGYTITCDNPNVATIGQNFILGNADSHTDVYNNTLCTNGMNPFNETTDQFGNLIGCGAVFDADGLVSSNFANTSGNIGSDGLPDGFPDPVRKYQAFEFQIEKRFSKNWQLVGNWRISKLFGNYEGLFRNDNQQDDANITSLFDFVASSSLGDQFTPGVLPTDRRDIVNVYGSYLFNNGFNLGFGWRFQTGYPLDKLAAHPFYLNQGEVPVGGRGSQGRSPATTNIDAHADYTWKMTERYRVKLVADLFNVINARRVARVDRYADTGVLRGVSPPIQPNPDFLLPTAQYDAYQHPFFARFSVRLEF